MSGDLARELLNLRSDQTLGFAIGLVTDTSPLTVRLNGDDVDIPSPPKNDDYTPTLGDSVFVLRPGPGLFVLCKIGN